MIDSVEEQDFDTTMDIIEKRKNKLMHELTVTLVSESKEDMEEVKPASLGKAAKKAKKDEKKKKDDASLEDKAKEAQVSYLKNVGKVYELMKKEGEEPDHDKVKKIASALKAALVAEVEAFKDYVEKANVDGAREEDAETFENFLYTDIPEELMKDQKKELVKIGEKYLEDEDKDYEKNLDKRIEKYDDFILDEGMPHTKEEAEKVTKMNGKEVNMKA